MSAIDRHEDEIQTSLHGKRFGIDHSGYLVGSRGLREAYQNSTAASTLSAFGVSVLTGTTATHTMPAPPANGVVKTIVNASSVSTATMSVIRGSSAFSFLGSTGGDSKAARVNLLNAGSAMSFVAITRPDGTLQWAPTVSKPSSLWYTVSTSS